MGDTNSTSTERQLSSEKAEAILAGGMQEFLTHGFAATSMDRVAKSAGVSKATVYSHFQDKEGLFNALIRRLVEEQFSLIFASSDKEIQQADPAIVLSALANRVLEVGTKDPQFINFMRVILGESGRFPKLARAFVRNIEKTAFNTLCQYLSSCLNLSDPEATARIFVGTLVHYLIVQEMLHGKDILPMERDRLVENLVTLIVGNSAKKI
ncbi:TetR/AcrR family transcriptional regulator [Aliterella atlantica]|uniref:TetR family transcriptional regulator n=1 Tax=Aliterella atlantica CENA595 TaxID=1618023 RepID=A0A0D8ZVD9_9CYAN|nr:TetR/AcrR family transcriptional regulator [Aliterella atlantica]KJH71186.1 TetR family transcriptional regulator [Aliterella atlantica CENA595]